jgi:hypothetical protein
MNQDKGIATFRRLKAQPDGILTSLASGHNLLDLGQMIFFHDLVAAVVHPTLRDNEHDPFNVRGEVKALQSDRQERPALQVHELLGLMAPHANPCTGCSDDGCGSHQVTLTNKKQAQGYPPLEPAS